MFFDLHIIYSDKIILIKKIQQKGHDPTKKLSLSHNSPYNIFC